MVSTAIENYIIDDWADKLNSLFATDLGDVQSKDFWRTKDSSIGLGFGGKRAVEYCTTSGNSIRAPN